MIKKNVAFVLLTSLLMLTACSAPAKVAEVGSDVSIDLSAVKVVSLDDPEIDTALANSDTVVPSTTERDNTPHVLETSAPGALTDGNEYATVDYSNASDGYIMVDYLGSSSKVKLQITGPNNVTYTYDIHNGYAAFPLVAGDGDYDISVCENIEGTKYSLSYRTNLNLTGISEFGPFLHPNQYVFFKEDNKTITKGANLAAYCSTDLEVVTNVYNYITKNITYDYEKADTVKSGYISDVDEILELGTGICLDYSAVMTSMLRSQGIPTRLEVGYVGKDMVYHAWISVYIEDVGWLNNIIQFNGYEWSLVDPTFGASTNAKTLKEYIGDGTNYSVKYVY